MCGIGGVVRVLSPVEQAPPIPDAIPESWLDALDTAMRHRGPDGAGRYRDRVVRPEGLTVDIALVHRRLSIIDHADGHQPMVSAKGSTARQAGRIAVVFNGCVYNHAEIRRELTGLGHAFATDHSDTEVWIHGWREWSERVVERLDGMHAVAIWDAGRGQLFLARDRFGEKPLYTMECTDERGGSIFAFSSTIPGLIRLAGMIGPGAASAASVSPKLLVPWLKYGWHGQPPFRGISSVEAGGHAVFPVSAEGDRVVASGRRWWIASNSGRQEAVTADSIDAALRRAVQQRLEADVPIGCFLSGGIDSSLIARYASEVHRGIACFTVRMPSPGFDESPAAAEVAAALGLRHEILDCESKPAEDLVATIGQLGLPFGDSSLLPTLWVSRAARRHVKVALSGDGGDELFLGYDRQRVIGILKSLEGVDPRLLRGFARLFHRGDSRRTWQSRASRFLAAAADGYEELLAIFTDEGLRRLGVDPGRPPGGAPSGGLDPLHFDVFQYLPNDLLRKTDSAAMSCALELRSPFLATTVVDPALRATVESLTPGGRPKGLLRQVAARYLPKRIVDRKKSGFSIPVGEWLRTDYGGLRTLLHDILASRDPFGEARTGVWIDPTEAHKLLAEHVSGARDHGQRLYMLTVLGVWSRLLV